MTPLQSLVASGTKLWLDSVDPDEVATQPRLRRHRRHVQPDHHRRPDQDRPVRRPTSSRFVEGRHDDETIAWAMTDQLVQRGPGGVPAGVGRDEGQRRLRQLRARPAARRPGAQAAARPSKSKQYIELGKKWSAGHKNRMIKVPATPGGLAALEELAAAGVTLNVTLIFSRTAIQRRPRRDLDGHAAAQVARQVQDRLQHLRQPASTCTPRSTCRTCRRPRRGRSASSTPSSIWQLNQRFWADKNLPLQQEMIFASTGTKKQGRPAVEVRRGVRRQRHRDEPAGDERRVQASGRTFTRQVDELPPTDVLDEIDDEGRHAEAGRDADGRRDGEVRRPAQSAAEADRARSATSWQSEEVIDLAATRSLAERSAGYRRPLQDSASRLNQRNHVIAQTAQIPTQ